MSSNLPPGVTEGMIPGNRPEDADFENMIEWLCTTGLSAGELRDAIVDYARRKKRILPRIGAAE